LGRSAVTVPPLRRGRPFLFPTFAMRKLLAFLAVVAVAACDSRIGSSFVAPLTPSIVGTFKLQTFNGRALPTPTTLNSTSALTIVGDTLTFNKDLTLRRAYAVIITNPGTTPTPRLSVTAGTYTLSNGVLALTLPGSTGFFIVTGTQSGSTVTINDAGDIWVYQK
jgi:hypothetical protein